MLNITDTDIKKQKFSREIFDPSKCCIYQNNFIEYLLYCNRKIVIDAFNLYIHDFPNDIIHDSTLNILFLPSFNLFQYINSSSDLPQLYKNIFKLIGNYLFFKI